MSELFISKEEVTSCVNELMQSFLINGVEVSDARYHHNTSYKSIISVVNHGILSLSECNKVGITNYSKDFLEVMDDEESHINGAYGVSLSVAGLKDLYSHKNEYISDDPNRVDILVSSDIKAYRKTYHYRNEFVCYDPIYPELFRAIDVRLLKYLDYCVKKNKVNAIEIINRYNIVVNMAKIINQKNLNIVFREMSKSNEGIDTYKMVNSPILKLKM